MPLTYIWEGNQASQVGNVAHAKNWLAFSIRNSAYNWTASGSGTNEYYLRTSASGNPGVPEPDAVQAGGSDMTGGTVGSLTAGQWDYGDNDALGYSTIYVRLSDGADPDSKAVDYLTFTDTPAAGHNILVPPGSAAWTNNTDLSAVALAAVRFDGGTGAIGSATAYAKLNCTSFYFNHTGTAYIDLTSSAVAPEIRGTAAASTVGSRGLYLAGVAVTTLNVLGGHVGFGWRAGELARCNTANCHPAGSGETSLWIGSQVVNVAGTGDPDVNMSGNASVISRCDVDEVVIEAGTYTQAEGVWADMEAYEGTVNALNAGTCAATVIAGATLDASGGSGTLTLTNSTFRNGSAFNDPHRRCVLTNAASFPDGIDTVTLARGKNITVAV